MRLNLRRNALHDLLDRALAKLPGCITCLVVVSREVLLNMLLNHLWMCAELAQ